MFLLFLKLDVYVIWRDDCILLPKGLKLLDRVGYSGFKAKYTATKTQINVPFIYDIFRLVK